MKAANLSRALWPWYAAVFFITSLWLSIHLVYGDIFFDADQAMVGLMGDDLVSGRAFPWTYYGQKYMLAIEVWFAALAFSILGPSITALKIPLAIVHLVTALMAFRAMCRDCRLSRWEALSAISPLMIPSVIAGAYLMGANGANAWPTFYVVALWMLRDRYVALGLLLGVGYFHREFVALGGVALLVCDALGVTECVPQRTQLWKRRLYSFILAQATYHGLVGLGKFNANFFGGGRPKMPLVGLPQMADNIRYILCDLLPSLLGLDAIPAKNYGLNVDVMSGLPILGLINMTLFVLLIASVVVGSLTCARRFSQWNAAAAFPLYAVLTTLGQVAVYVLYIPANSAVLARYLLFVPLGLSGAIALAFVIARHRWPKYIFFPLLFSLSMAWGNLIANGNVVADRIQKPWLDPRRSLAEFLSSKGYRYGWASYWDAYYLSFITNEKLIVAASDHTRIRRYRDIVKEHQSKAFVVTSNATECPPAVMSQFESWFVCPMPEYRGEIPALTQGR